MRYISLGFLLTLFTYAQAADTLTRAQVYNFSLGDTFDYKHFEYDVADLTGVVTTSVTYQRKVVYDMIWSPDSSQKSIVIQQIYPGPVQLDTLSLDSLQRQEVILDTIWFSPPQYSWYDSIIIDSSAPYFGAATNCIVFPYYGGVEGGETRQYADGLGLVVDFYWGALHGGTWSDSTVLIYYNGVNGTFGSPYTSILTPVEDFTNINRKLKIFPAINNGAFTVETPDEVQLPLTFALYDLQGRKVNEWELNNRTNEVYTLGLSKCLYIWKATSCGKFIQTGRMVIE